MATAIQESATRRRLGVRSVPLPILVLGGLIVARLALAEWWLILDEAVVDTESGRQLQRAWDGYSLMAQGDPWTLFRTPTEYPPLHYLVGDLGALVAGLDVESFIGAQTLLFVPLLAIGCYGIGTLAYGRTAGLLAAVFALGTPMAVSVFHMYLIDTTELAMVAVSVWAILATDRFSRTGISALAGVAAGLGMLSKQNYPVFIVGLVAVVILRGGWRHWRGALVFVAIAALISASWYWSEIGRTLDLIRGASADTSATAGAVAPASSRLTVKNLGYYVWNTANVSVLTPFTLAAVGGGLALLVRWMRRRERGDLTPELVAGALFSYAALTWISLKDPRYALPMLPYLAVLGTGWIALLRGRWRVVAASAVAALALLNVVMTVWVSGPPGSIFIKGAPGNSQGRQLTFWLPGGWIAGRPETSSAIVDVMRAAHANGIDAVAFDPGANQSRFNHPGLDILSRVAKVPIAIPFDPNNPREVIISNRNPPLANPKPCGLLSDGTGIYLSRGPVDIPFEQRRFWCPPRR